MLRRAAELRRKAGLRSGFAPKPSGCVPDRSHPRPEIAPPVTLIAPQRDRRPATRRMGVPMIDRTQPAAGPTRSRRRSCLPPLGLLAAVVALAAIGHEPRRRPARAPHRGAGRPADARAGAGRGPRAGRADPVAGPARPLAQRSRGQALALGLDGPRRPRRGGGARSGSPGRRGDPAAHGDDGAPAGAASAGIAGHRPPPRRPRPRPPGGGPAAAAGAGGQPLLLREAVRRRILAGPRLHGAGDEADRPHPAPAPQPAAGPALG